MIKKLFNIFKKKDPIIHFWSTVDGLDKVMPPIKASKFIPQWWKNIPKNYKEEIIESKGTIRNCPALPDLWSEGYVMRLWCDLWVKIDKERFEWKTPDGRFTFEHHSSEQFLKWVPEHVQKNTSLVLKPNCPWRIKTDPGYSVLQLPLYYQFNPIFDVLPGTIWTDMHHTINQQMLFKSFGEFKIERGTPLAVYIPFKRTKYKEIISENNEELKKLDETNLTRIRGKFRGAYREAQKGVKKCPFHQ